MDTNNITQNIRGHMRITKSNIQDIYLHFITAFCKKTGDNPEDYSLDYVSHYGGYVIEQKYGESGGISHPFGTGRRPASEMYRTLNFAIYALYE
jgi:hypothetical protein